MDKKSYIVRLPTNLVKMIDYYLLESNYGNGKKKVCRSSAIAEAIRIRIKDKKIE